MKQEIELKIMRRIVSANGRLGMTTRRLIALQNYRERKMEIMNDFAMQAIASRNEGKKWKTNKEDEYEVRIMIAPDCFRGDIDNAAKMPIDAAQDAGIIGNDKQIKKLIIEKSAKESKIIITKLGRKK